MIYFLRPFRNDFFGILYPLELLLENPLMLKIDDLVCVRNVYLVFVVHFEVIVVDVLVPIYNTSV